jgi:preprotein translocase subunit SecB
MKTGPLSLQRIYFTDVHVYANPSAKETDVDHIDVEIFPKLNKSAEDTRRWTVVLMIKFASKEGIIAPYTGHMENIGGFLVAEGWPEDQIEKLVYVNACGILYASMREMVSIITGRGFFPPLTLPSCSFMEMFKAQEEAKKKEMELSTQPPLNLPAESTAG